MRWFSSDTSQWNSLHFHLLLPNDHLPHHQERLVITKLLVTWHPCAGPFSEPRTNKSVLIILPAYCIDTVRRIFFNHQLSIPRLDY